MRKRPFDIDIALERVEDAVRPLAKAAMFELAEAGFRSVFEQLIACIISIRTYDEVTLPVARRLFARARTPEGTLAALTAKLPREHWVDINRLLVPFGKHICTLHRPQCPTCPLLDMCRQVGVKPAADLLPAHL